MGRRLRHAEPKNARPGFAPRFARKTRAAQHVINAHVIVLPRIRVAKRLPTLFATVALEIPGFGLRYRRGSAAPPAPEARQGAGPIRLRPWVRENSVPGPLPKSLPQFQAEPHNEPNKMTITGIPAGQTLPKGFWLPSWRDSAGDRHRR